MQLLRRLVLNEFVYSSQIVFVDYFVLFGFRAVVDRLVKILGKEVSAFELPLCCLFG